MEDNLLITGSDDLQLKAVDLLKAAMTGDEDANTAIEQIFQAAEQGDEQASQLASIISELTKDMPQAGGEEDDSAPGAEAFKCGGKVRAKIKKAACGKKMQQGGETEIPEEKEGGKASKVRKACGGSKVKKAEKGEPITKTWSKSDSSFSVKYGEKGIKCPCQLKRVGGKIVSIDTCTGLPIHKEGGKVVKAQLGWLANNGVRLIGDGLGTLLGKGHEYGQKAVGYGQQLIGGAAQAVTNGQRGAGWVKAGADKRATAKADGARTNRVIDEASGHLGNVAGAGVNVAQAFVNPLWAAADAGISYGLGKTVGNYNPVTGSRTTDFLHNYSNDAEPDGTVMSTSTPGTGTTGPTIIAQKTPVNSIPVETLDPAKQVKLQPATPITGRYSKYGMQYKKDTEGNIVEDWNKTKVSNRDIARAARKDNWASYRQNRDAIYGSGMSWSQKQAALKEQRNARRTANADARNWRNAQQAAYDEKTMQQLAAGNASYAKNGGSLTYAQYLN